MRFLNCDKVLCLAAHPDDVEYGMLGSIMKYTDTKFDILVLSEGGNFDDSTSTNRHSECEAIWKDIDNIEGSFLSTKHLADVSEDELINMIESKFDILVLSEGGNFDESTSVDRHKECESIWEDIDTLYTG